MIQKMNFIHLFKFLYYTFYGCDYMDIEKLAEEIINGIDPSWDTLTKIRYVYIEVGKRVVRDTDFFFSVDEKLGDKNLTVDEIVQIYDSEYGRGNKVICKSASNILKKVYDKLGIIFPEPFYKVLTTYKSGISKLDKYYMNYLLKQLTKTFRIGKKIEIEFPVGNMFWSKITSIYQIFDLNKIINKFPKEKNQIDGTIMHGIERFWIYLVKFNGYYYKKIFKHL